MKRNTLFITLLILISTGLNGQITSSKEPAAIRLERIRIEAQYKLDSIRLEAEKELALLKCEAEDSLLVAKSACDRDSKTLENEALLKQNKLLSDARRGLFNGKLRQTHYEKQLSDLENEYTIKMSGLEEKCTYALKRIENHYTCKFETLESETEAKILIVESRYRKEAALIDAM